HRALHGAQSPMSVVYILWLRQLKRSSRSKARIVASFGQPLLFLLAFGFGFLKETLVAPVPRILIMLGRTLGGATVAVIQGILVFVLCLLVGFRPVTL